MDALHRRRGFAHLQEAITGEADFAERNQWGAREWPKRVRKLICESGDRLLVSEENLERIVDALRRAILACEVRNLIAHGHWWQLDQDVRTITVRRGKLRPCEQRHVSIPVADIDPHSTSASRCNAGACGFFSLIQSGDNRAVARSPCAHPLFFLRIFAAFLVGFFGLLFLDFFVPPFPAVLRRCAGTTLSTANSSIL